MLPGKTYGEGTKKAVMQFVSKYGKDIVEAIKKTGLFFSAVVAQKCLESGYGKSTLASKYNNFGGIKNFGKMENAGVVYLDTTEIVKGKKVGSKEPFATYPTPKAGFESYVRLLKSPTAKYTAAGVFTANSADEQILRMAQAGYTTMSPTDYLNSLKGILDCCDDVYSINRVI